MQKLITLVFAISISFPALADSKNNVLPVASPVEECDCSDVINAADEVIKRQDNLLIFQKTRLDELQSDNDKLSEAIVKLSRENDKQTSPVVWVGAGFAAGVITILLLGGSK